MDDDQELWMTFCKYSQSSFMAQKDLRNALKDYGLPPTAVKAKGQVSFSLFQQLVEEFMEAEHTIASCRAVFTLFSSATDEIDLNSMMLSCRKHTRFNADEVQELFQEADLNGDGKIDFKEFKRVLRKSGMLPQIL